MEDFYGTNLDYIHLKFGRMQKSYNFTKAFRKKYPNFCEEYEKHWNNDESCRFKSPIEIAAYVDIFKVPVKFYYNYTDEPSKGAADVYEYFIRETRPYDIPFVNGLLVGWDGEEDQRSEYKVSKA